MKLEEAKCGLQYHKGRESPEWVKRVRINGEAVKTLLDTGCTKTLVHPRCIRKDDYLGWSISYNTASKSQVSFPAANVRALFLERGIISDPASRGFGTYRSGYVDGERCSPLPTADKERTRESELKRKETTTPDSVATEMSMAVIHAQLLKQTALEEEESLK